MNQNDLQNVVEKLDAALEAIGMTGHEDTRLMPIYMEYWVANELSRRGHEVEVVNRRSFDILLPESQIRIEVKSGKFEGSATASFSDGRQITEQKFDYCVFATYDIDFRVKEALIFSREELQEVASKPRPHRAQHPKNNFCFLFRYDSLSDYLKNEEEKDRLEIELKLHTHPEDFVSNWEKIKQLSQ
jgi:hypothetical protein